MRIRTAAAGVLILVLASIGFTSPAHAASSVGACIAEVALEAAELHGAGVTDEEIIHDLEAKGEACVEAPNPVFPDPVEMIWISIAFGVLLILGLKFAYPMVTKAMEDRSERIRADLEAAEKAKTDALAEQAKYQSELGDGKAEASRIVEEARVAAAEIKARAASDGEAEGAAAREKGVADAEAIKAQALADLRSEVTALAVGAAERVVGANLDADAQAQLIDDYINQVGTRN